MTLKRIAALVSILVALPPLAYAADGKGPGGGGPPPSPSSGKGAGAPPATSASVAAAATPPATASAEPVPARPMVPTGIKCESGAIVANWPAAPRSDCWTPRGVTQVAGGVYQLTPSAECVSTLPSTRGATRIDGAGVVAFEGKPAAGTPCIVSKSGGAPRPLAPQPSFANMAVRGDVTFVDDEGVHVSDSPSVSSHCRFDEDPDTSSEAYVHVQVDVAAAVVRTPPRNVVLPNQGLVVRICRAPGQSIKSVEWDGTRGLTASGATNDATKALARAAPLSEVVIQDAVVQEFRFAPRQAGSTNLKISYVEASGQAVDLPPIEIEIDALYWGSVRVGLGSLFDVAQNWQSYSIQTVAGSRQPEIRQAHSGVGFEIVNGFAPYLLDLLVCPGRGRSYTGGCNLLVSPFVGFGIVGAGAQGVQALSSFHAGLEIEFAKSFSIAATVAVRRMQALTTGYVVGSPVTSETTAQDVTRDAWSPGFGVVVNATPSFLQFAMPDGSGNAGTK